jgi:hypothetical protein
LKKREGEMLDFLQSSSFSPILSICTLEALELTRWRWSGLNGASRSATVLVWAQCCCHEAYDLSQSQERGEDMGEREGEMSIRRSDIREEREKERSGNERRK